MNEWRPIVLEAGFWTATLLSAICFGGVVAGPSNVDRAVAIDLGMVLIAVALGLFSALNGTGIYMDAALVMAIVSFLVTVFLARALEDEKVERE